MFDEDGLKENSPITDTHPFADEIEEVDDESALCDCDPEHKESQTVQQSTGLSVGGFGGQMGDGTTVIVCTKCGGRFYENEEPDTEPELY